MKKSVDLVPVRLLAAEIFAVELFHPGVHGKGAEIAESEQRDAVGDLIPYTRVCDERLFQRFAAQGGIRGIGRAEVFLRQAVRVGGEIGRAIAESERTVERFILSGDVGKPGKSVILPTQEAPFFAEGGAEGKEHFPDAGDVVLLGEDKGQKAFRAVLPQNAHALGKFRGAGKKGNAETFRFFTSAP